MRALVILAVAIAGLAVACSSSTGTPGAADASVEAPAAVLAAKDNCVKPGYRGNERGVGAFCDDTASCPASSTTFLVCTAYHDAPSNAYFCTAPCTSDADCGSRAYCDKSPRGSGCVPFECGSAPDAGADASPSDAADASG